MVSKSIHHPLFVVIAGLFLTIGPSVALELDTEMGNNGSRGKAPRSRPSSPPPGKADRLSEEISEHHDPAAVSGSLRDLPPPRSYVGAEVLCPPSKAPTARRRPGQTFKERDYTGRECDRQAAPPPLAAALGDPALVPDRWRIVSDLGYPERLYDPYNNNNVLKGDRPVHGDWFFNIIGISDNVVEPRYFPVPVGNQTTNTPASLDLIGDGKQLLLVSSLITEFVYYKGNTVFKPPDYEFRLTPVFQYNYIEFEEKGLARADFSDETIRGDYHLGWQSAFFDYHIRNVSDRYDFDSFRIGIQPFSSDFRGFLFQDQQLGIRFFGIRKNNIFQYNLAWFRRLEKDTNSGLNRIDKLRDDDVFIANLYWQDFPKLGFFSQVTAAWNRNREKGEIVFDDNGFIARPASLGFERSREYDAYYLGYNGDGHFGRLNLTVSGYYVFGEQTNGLFANNETSISAGFAAAEAGFDFSWTRLRLSALYATGDDDPFDDEENGFDAIFENPQFAGADTSYWIRQTVPLIGGGRVAISQRNGVLNNLRSSKELGQSNFTNPGILLAGIGADFDLTPTTRLSLNANQLWFDETAVLEVARNQGNIDKEIGQDLSAAVIYRPFATQNIVLRMSGAVLVPGEGFKDLYGDQADMPYSVLGNFLFTY